MVEKQLTPVIQESFLQFAGAVLQSRALVDVRDCIKPSARQIFYCMETDKFTHDKPFQKTLKAIGSAFRLYIHGDSSAEGVIMRAGQPFAYRYPLVEVEGSYGTLLSGESWAAPRYTASRLSPLASYLFADLKKNVIEEWRDNYDNTEQYPTVLPSKGFYNIVNGSFGLGVGGSCSIPQYNLRELNNALINLLNNPDCPFDDIYVAPDFATGATIINAAEVKESHLNGNGRACKIRSTVEWDAKDRCLIVTEIPYMVYTETICRQLEEIINEENDKVNPGIERFNDLTGTSPLIKIYLSKRANPDNVLKFLYKNTSLEDYFGINFTMLDNGRFPKLFTWRETLQAHIDHEKVIYKRGFEFDLKKITDRIHIIDGLLICCASIEEVVRVIKSAESTQNASILLQKNFLLDELQAKAVLDMKLSRLAHLEVKKLENEKEDLEREYKRINSILSDPVLFNQQLINGWKEISTKFGDERRTKILDLGATTSNEPIEVKQLQLSLTNQSNLIMTETSSLYSQKRGGVGTKTKLANGEYVINSMSVKSTDNIMFFNDKGSYYTAPASSIPIETKIPVCTVTKSSDDNIIAINSLDVTNLNKYIIFITKNGLVKKSELSEYSTKSRVGGIKALTLDEGDLIVSILFTNDDNIGLLTSQGNFIMFDSSSVRPIGRVARGIKGMKLNEDDYIVNGRCVRPSAKFIVSVSREGYIKKTSINEFNVQGTNTKGFKLQKLNDSDLMADFLPINDMENITIVSSSSCIKFGIADVPILGRAALGVRSIKLGEKNFVINLT